MVKQRDNEELRAMSEDELTKVVEGASFWNQFSWARKYIRQARRELARREKLGPPRLKE